MDKRQLSADKKTGIWRWCQKRHEIEYNSGNWIILQFCISKKRHDIEYNSGNWIVLEKLHRQQRLGINFNLRNQIVFELASAKETQNRIQFKTWIALRFCNGKRDSTTNIICETKVYSVLHWQKRRGIEYNLENPNYIINLRWQKRQILNTILEIELY